VWRRVIGGGNHVRVAELLVAPYLVSPGDVTVGPWQLLPFGSISDSDQVPDDLRRPVRRLVEAYQIDDAIGLGAIAYPATAHVGAEFDHSAIRPLARALLAGSVADNPPMCVAEDDAPANAGHMVATAENALVWGHPLQEGDSYAIESGTLAKTLDLRYAPGDEPLPKIAPPDVLPKPIFGHFDAELADATHRLLSRGDTLARRLTRALDWYAVALSNAEAVTPDVRVGAARSALEVLIGSGSESKKLVRAYGKLVRDDETAELIYEDVFWADGPVQLTADEWWLTGLSELRNAIVHGDEIDAEMWHHDNHHQVNHIHDRLIDTIKAVVAGGADDPLLRLRLGDRGFQRLADEYFESVREIEQGGDEATGED
jgi:hypothetical protein